MKGKKKRNQLLRKEFIRMARWNLKFFGFPKQPEPGFKYVHFMKGLMMILPVKENANEARKDLDNSSNP